VQKSEPRKGVSFVDPAHNHKAAAAFDSEKERKEAKGLARFETMRMQNKLAEEQEKSGKGGKQVGPPCAGPWPWPGPASQPAH
jgi:hypothetical protein